jgi:hypothetical protein
MMLDPDIRRYGCQHVADGRSIVTKIQGRIESVVTAVRYVSLWYMVGPWAGFTVAILRGCREGAWRRTLGFLPDGLDDLLHSRHFFFVAFLQSGTFYRLGLANGLAMTTVFYCYVVVVRHPKPALFTCAKSDRQQTTQMRTLPLLRTQLTRRHRWLAA